MTRQLLRVGAVAVSVLAGSFAASGVHAAEKVELRLIYSSYPELYDDLVGKFEALHPDIKITTESTGASYTDFTQKVLRGSVVDDLPDIAIGSSNHIRLFAERGMLQPLDNYMSSDPEWAKLGYMSSVLPNGMFQGKQYGLQYGLAEPVIFYNADLVRAAGGDPDNFPSDWDGIIKLGGKIDALPDDAYGFFMSHFEHTSNWTFLALLQSVGGKMVNEDETKVAFDDEKGLWDLNMFRRFAKEAGQPDITVKQARAALDAGKLGIFASSSSYISNFATAAKGNFDARTGPWPIPDAIGSLPPGGNALLMFTKDKAKQDAAWEFIKFAAGPVGQTALLAHTGYAPNNEIAIKSREYLGGYYEANPIYKVTIDQLPRLTVWYAFPSKNSLRVSDAIRDYLQEVVTLKRTPEEVMPDMARDVQALLTE